MENQNISCSINGLRKIWDDFQGRNRAAIYGSIYEAHDFSTVGPIETRSPVAGTRSSVFEGCACPRMRDGADTHHGASL